MINRHLKRNAISKQKLRNHLYKVCLSILTDESIVDNLKSNPKFEEFDIISKHSVALVENVIKEFILSKILARSVGYLDKNKNTTSNDLTKIKSFISTHRDLIEKYNIKPSEFPPNNSKSDFSNSVDKFNNNILLMNKRRMKRQEEDVNMVLKTEKSLYNCDNICAFKLVDK